VAKDIHMNTTPNSSVHPNYSFRPDEPHWLVEDVVAVGEVVFVYSFFEKERTYTALDIGVCTALGIPWLGHKTQQCNVLYVGESYGAATTKRHLYQVGSYHGADTGIPLALATDNDIVLSTDEGMQKLYNAASAQNAGLIIIDTFGACLKRFVDRENFDDKEAANAWRRLREFTVATRTGILVTSHVKPSSGPVLDVSQDDFLHFDEVANMTMLRDNNVVWSTPVTLQLPSFELSVLNHELH
jgi:hypothetical protein